MRPDLPVDTSTGPRSGVAGTRRGAPVGTAPAVASAAARALHGPAATARVLAAGRGAVLVGGPDAGVVLVVGPAAPRLPVTVHVDVVLAGFEPGTTARLGGGALVLDGLTIKVARWFDPAVRLPGPYRPAAVAALAAVVAGHPGGDAALGADPVERLAAALGGGDDLDAAVAALVGRGGGSTPAGDDVLAGALAALAVVGAPGAARLAAAVAPHRGATTRLSAALLDHAARAEVAAAAVPVLRALTGGGDVDAAVAPLFALGHTSGHHLAAGIALGAGVAA